jgi:hypothetical protein
MQCLAQRNPFEQGASSQEARTLRLQGLWFLEIGGAMAQICS